MPTHLPPAQLLEISGADALAFARAQFSSDVTLLADGHWQWSAWLSAQGRVRAFFQLLRADSTRLLAILRGGSAAALQVALAPYVLRSKVQLLTPQALHTVGYFSAPEVQEAVHAVPQGQRFVEKDGAIGLALPGVEPRWTVVTAAAPQIAAQDAPQDPDRWRAADIGAGIVHLDSALLDRYLPAWIGLDRLGAVSVSKGCYPGQEIVARMHFKGGNKRWLHRIEFTSTTLPADRTALDSGSETPPGELLNAVWIEPHHGVALAVLPKLADGTILKSPELPGALFRVVSAVERAND